MALALLEGEGMGTALELVYQYRQLSGKCESGAGLDVDEIEVLITIEALFDRRGRAAVDDDEDLWSCRREFSRERVDLRGMLRSARLADPVRISDLGPGGLVCRGAPWAKAGESVEIVIDDRELSLSYRFKGVVSWSRDGEDGAVLGLTFVGLPLLVRYGPAPSVTEDDLDELAA
jgi:hypothetical protein